MTDNMQQSLQAVEAALANRPKAPNPNRSSLLVEREKTHGDYLVNAKVAQGIKSIIGWGDVKGMKDTHRECTDHIATRLARIAAGNANHKEHWIDIKGYCDLALESCE